MDLTRLLRYLIVFSFGCTIYFFTATFNQSNVPTTGNFHVVFTSDTSEERKQLVLETLRENVVVGENNLEILISDNQKKLVSHCDRIHVVLMATSISGAREVVTCLKTILHFRNRPLILHLFVNDQSYYVLNTLFNTWQLPMVDIYYYRECNSSIKTEEEETRLQFDLFLKLPQILPINVTKIIFTNNRMRFLHDITDLWSDFQMMKTDQVASVSFSRAKQAPPMLSIVLLDLGVIRLKKYSLNVTMLQRKSRTMDCSWNVQIRTEAEYNSCTNLTKAVFFIAPRERRAGYLEPLKETLGHILSSDGEVYRSTPIPCAYPTNLVTDIPITILKNKCAEFYYSTKLKRRTHLFYMGTYSAIEGDSNEITLMTMFTLDRIDAFELILKYWSGPVTVVIYATDEELLTLRKKLDRSPVVTGRHNVAYHIVYKRHRLYPINYLRNIALKNTHTPYSVFIDVDLVPKKDLYKYLKDYVKDVTDSKDCLVIPAFQANIKLEKFPEERTDLMKLMKKGTVVGYGQNGFSAGHSPTNYKRWSRTDTPYYVTYESRYEPYILMKTKEMPLYSEDVLDRMRDKVLFTQELNRRGYKFKVLPQTFVIHTPHPVSDNKYFYQHEALFTQCKEQMLRDHARHAVTVWNGVSTSPIPLAWSTSVQRIENINNFPTTTKPTVNPLLFNAKSNRDRDRKRDRRKSSLFKAYKRRSLLVKGVK